MKAKRCDRCGCFYLGNEKFRHEQTNFMLESVRFIFYGRTNSNSEEYELCDSCQEELINWFESGNITKLPVNKFKEDEENED